MDSSVSRDSTAFLCHQTLQQLFCLIFLLCLQVHLWTWMRNPWWPDIIPARAPASPSVLPSHSSQSRFWVTESHPRDIWRDTHIWEQAFVQLTWYTVSYCRPTVQGRMQMLGKVRRQDGVSLVVVTEPRASLAHQTKDSQEQKPGFAHVISTCSSSRSPELLDSNLEPKHSDWHPKPLVDPANRTGDFAQTSSPGLQDTSLLFWPLPSKHPGHSWSLYGV